MIARVFRRMLQVVGVALVLTGLSLNPWVLRRYVLLDGDLQHWREVVFVEGLMVATGLLAVRAAGRQPEVPRAVSPHRVAFVAVAVAGSSLLAVASAELAAHLLVRPEQLLRGGDLWEYEWRAAHRAGQPLGWVIYAFDRYDPELGWRPAPSFSSGPVRTNAQGIRADRDVSRARTPGRSRIVTVGDSYTWGEEVANDETYPAQLEAALPDTEVLNFGVHGYGIDQATLRLQGDALAYAPDLVILGFIDDDLERDVLSFRSFAKPRFELVGSELLLTHVPVPTPEQVLEAPQELPRCYLAALARDVVDGVLDRTRLRPDATRERWLVTEALLEEAKRASERAGARFMLAYFPTQLGTQAVPGEHLAADWAQRNGVRFIDLRPAFAALPEDRWRELYRGVHWSPAGNRLVSRLLRDEIVRRNLLSSPPVAALH
jgi:hypothetical protein